MRLLRLVLIVVLLMLPGCGEEMTEPPEVSSAKQDSTVSAQPAAENSPASATQSGAGGVTASILPENPTAKDCLRVLVQGRPGSSVVEWKINGAAVETGTNKTFCSDDIGRGDRVEVVVGTVDQGAKDSVEVVNSLPEVVDISSSPEEIYAGTDVIVTPVAEDMDGDDVSFSYQWLVNGEADPALTEATLPGTMFSKGDTIQVQITPNDFYDDGPVYESYAMPVPNAAPQITSQPPQEIDSLDYVYQVVASDPDDSIFTYRLDAAPEGMTIDESTGEIRWSLMEAKPGEHTIAVIVSDPDGAEAAQEYTLTLSPAQ